MKRTVLSLALLVMALTVGAQTIKVNYQKGDANTYKKHVDISVGAPMQGSQKGSVDETIQYTVTDVSDGYTVEMKTADYAIAGPVEILQKFGNGDIVQALKKTPAVLKLDKQGKVVDIVNSEAVLASQAEAVVDGINKLYEKNPKLESVFPKAKMLMTANEQLTKDNLLKTIIDESVFSLNGKTIKDGETVDETVMDKIKMKSTYSIASAPDLTTVTRTAVSNMTEDDIKALIKSQLEQSGGDANAMMQIETMWNQLKAMGMTKLDLNSTGTSSFSSNGWLKSDTQNMTVSVMGAKIKVASTTTLQ